MLSGLMQIAATVLDNIVMDDKQFKLFKTHIKCQPLSHAKLFAVPWTIACQAPLSMEFSRQKFWSGQPFPSPGNFLDPSPLQFRQILYHLSHQGNPLNMWQNGYSNSGIDIAMRLILDMLVKVCFCNYGNFPKKITGVIHNANLGLKGA